ncbi:hypothetical protein ACQR16_33970 [Bradyrhizobium oligotrophicum]|uniref:hypothetical protein n=1 Tax=Bradyrhizobium oligotrophicum TaxID=44255 RepID=UPI003EBAAB0D
MFRLNLGGGAVAFETEGEADRIGSVDPAELTSREWPPEVVANIRRYQERLAHPMVKSASEEPDSGS